MKLDRVMIAAPKSGSGKTTITCAILQTLKDMGKQVVSYKCGPDYILSLIHICTKAEKSHSASSFLLRICIYGKSGRE